jgi:hypothetical protein
LGSACDPTRILKKKMLGCPAIRFARGSQDQTKCEQRKSRLTMLLDLVSITGYQQKKYCRLKPIDIVVLKKLTEVVNVVPVIAKSDSLTIEERIAFKHRVSFSIRQSLLRCFFSIDMVLERDTVRTDTSIIVYK